MPPRKSSGKPCIDCAKENQGHAYPQRPAPYRGPRCYSHHIKERNRLKEVAHERHVQNTYGLAPGEFAELFDYQGRWCALCHRARGVTRNLLVDHDHQTGDPRGLLCKNCNNMLGHGRDEVAFFQRVITYLQSPPYRQMKAWKALRGEP